MVLEGTIVNGVTAAAVLAAHAIAAVPAAGRPLHAPWPDRPTRFPARKG
jgi:ADP-ribose pyrophosphatase